MAKKIRFPLEMENGVEVRSLEELRDNFSMVRVIDYMKSGKLVVWLRDRYATDIADTIEQLNKDDPNLSQKLSEIFDVTYVETSEEELNKSIEQIERKRKLMEFTKNEKYFSNIDRVAFNQEELYDLLDEGSEVIYLCGLKFSIPLAKSGVTYIGINNPTVIIDSKNEVDWEKRGIFLQNVVFDEKYLSIIEENKICEKSKTKSYECHTIYAYTGMGGYSSNEVHEGLLTENDCWKYIFLNKKIYKTEADNKDNKIEIMGTSHFNYQKLIGCGNTIVFNYMVGNNDGDHLCVYYLDIDIYEPIDQFVYEFTVAGDFIYYEKASDKYLYSERKLMRCDLNGENKIVIKDLGKINHRGYDMKVAKNRLYYKIRDAFEEHMKYVDL